MNQIAKQEWTAEETETLICLLEKVKADKGWWPDEACMRAAHGAMSAWASELVIFERWWMRYSIFRNWRKILLTTYEGGIEEFHGKWHIPGGYGTPRDSTFQRTCSRVAMAELKMNVSVIRTFPHPYLWLPGNSDEKPEHPYGRPLSIYTLVRPLGIIHETDTCRFFGKKDLPENIVPVHRLFIEEELFRLK